MKGDARNLPFDDDTFDVVFSSAVLEHVGSNIQQQKMLSECYRVCRKGMFITTPNKYYPVDFHTVLPFVHWFPKIIKDKILLLLNLEYFSSEDNLNLLAKKDLMLFMKNLGIQDYTIKKIRLFLLVSNHMLIVQKKYSKIK